MNNTQDIELNLEQQLAALAQLYLELALPLPEAVAAARADLQHLDAEFRVAEAA
jgi:hypothetical protein